MTSPISSTNPYNPTNDPLIQSAPPTSNNTTTDSLENISDGQTLNYSDYSRILSNASVNLSQGIREALQSDAEFSLNFFRALAEGSNELLNLYATKEAEFLSKTIKKEKTGPAIDTLNEKNSDMINAIQNQSDERTNLTQARQDYQSAVDTFNNTPSGATDDEKAAALATFNSARTTYNQAVENYNTAVTTTNQAITDYRAAFTAYQTLVISEVNPSIEAANVNRSPPLIPYQTVPTDHTNWSYTNGSTATLLTPPTVGANPGVQPSPPGVPTIPAHPPYALDIKDPRDLKFTDEMEEFTNEAIKFFGFTTDQVRALRLLKEDLNPSGAEYKKKVRLNPEASTNEVETAPPVMVGGPGGIGLATLTLKINPQTANAIMSENLAKQKFVDEQVTVPTEVYSTLLTMTIKAAVQTGALASYPAVAFLNGYLATLPPNSPAVGIAASLGYNDTLVSLLNKPGLLISIQNMLGNIPSLANLTAQQKEKIAIALTAQVSDALLRIGVNTLQEQLKVDAVGDTLKVAALLANPNANVTTYQETGAKLAALLKDFKATDIALPLTDFLQGKLIAAGLSAQEAQSISSRVAASAVTQGLGKNPNSLAQIDLGVDVSPDIRNAIFEGVVIFTAAALLKQDVQASIIGSSGAAQALNLSEKIVGNLYGFSGSLTQSEGGIQETLDARPTSIVQVAASNYRHDVTTSNQETLNSQRERYSSARREDSSLDAFQRILLDPGHKQFGLMYEGTDGGEFERKSVDIKVA